MHQDTTLLVAWAEHVRVLASAAGETTRSEDRQQYARHLAAAAVIGSKLVSGDYAAARELVESERHAYGRSFLLESRGERAEQAFTRFAHLF